MLRVDDDDVVAAINVRGVGREVLAAQAHGDDGGETADDQTLGVDQHPLLRHLSRLCRKGFHIGVSVDGRYRREHRTGLRGFLEKRRATVNARRRKLLMQNQWLKNMVLYYLLKAQTFGME
jgi:hypothetical protein